MGYQAGGAVPNVYNDCGCVGYQCGCSANNQYAVGSASSKMDLALNPTTTYTSATAGSASALPALPLGYIEITIGSTAVKIPYYSP